MIVSVMCGGAGSRLWPVSREKHPKPFIRLDDGMSFLEKTFCRAAKLPGVRAFAVNTNEDLYFQVAHYLEALNLRLPVSYLLEPMGRNTAPAIAAAALYTAAQYGPKELMLVLPADHLIENEDVFGEAVKAAQALAEKDRLVTFGLKPDRPETGYGYIEASGNSVLAFVEKPDRERAETFLRQGNYYWNAGMFCFRAGVMLRELEQYAPQVLGAVRRSMPVNSVDDAGKPGASAPKKSGGSPASSDPKNPPEVSPVVHLSMGAFSQAPDISIDYAVMEKSDAVGVIPCDLGWQDIGSWGALFSGNTPDGHGNRVASGSDAVLEDCKACDVRGDGGRLVAGLGLENLLIVDTPDALLVADKSRDQDVKKIYARLKEEQREEMKFHSTVYRPWGSFTVLEVGPQFKIKRLVIRPGQAISLQLHHHRSEHWVVAGGMAKVTCEDKTYFVSTNESTYIKAGHRHSVANDGLVDLVIIEVQIGEYVGEDDIVRFSDIYGRA